MTSERMMRLLVEIDRINDCEGGIDPAGSCMLQILCAVREFMDSENCNELTWESIESRVAQAQAKYGTKVSRKRKPRLKLVG
jgi:hypothetical protein